MIKVFVDCPSISNDILKHRLQYTLDFIQNHPCSPLNVIWSLDEGSHDVVVGYGDKNSPNYIPFVPFVFSTQYENLPHHKSLVMFDRVVHGFGPKEDIGFSIDIFQTIFYHISRYEEWNCTSDDTDQHGMMKSDLQFLVKNSLQDTPVVDHLVFVLYKYLGLEPIKIETKYTLTHDIDAIRRLPSFYKFLRAIANIGLYQKNKLRGLGKLLKTYCDIKFNKMPDPYDTFSWLLVTTHPKIVDRFIYFLSGGRTQYENFFRIQDFQCQPIYDLARQQGYTFGIHPSYLSCTDENMMEKEKNRLEQVLGQNISHSRQHFLRYDMSQTGQILDNLNIQTDSSMGYRNKTGFRCGTGFPYYMYNFNEEKKYDFLERPMVVMDMAIIHEVGWDAQKFIELLDNFLEKNKYFTHITFNFHNSTFDPILFDSVILVQYYKRLLGHSQ